MMPPASLAPPASKPVRGHRTPRCPACFLPVALCVCAELPRLLVQTRVVIVMHRREAITSTNTGRLAAQMLEGARVRVRGAPQAEDAPVPEGRRLALYPAPGCRVLGPEDAAGERVVLLVPDGTWPQARRLLRRDDLLQGAEPVSLPDVGPTRYGLRRCMREGTLCTLEAIARALGVLEGPAIEERLGAAFDHFVERARIARTGRFEL